MWDRSLLAVRATRAQSLDCKALGGVRLSLGHAALVDYLLEKELLTAQQLVTGQLAVSDISRRNYNTRVVTDGVSLLVKQATDPESLQTLHREARIYQLIQQESAYSAIRQHVAYLRHFDEVNGILILELLQGEDLERYHAQGYFSLILARQTGKAIARLHGFGCANASWRSETATQLPWAFSIGSPRLSEFMAMSPAATDVVKLVQREGFTEFLARAAIDWTASTPVHGDIKWANLIAHPGPGKKRLTQIKIVDWEYASFGDPAWDIAGVFASYLAYWILGMSISANTSASEWDTSSRYPLGRMQPAILAFWKTYAGQSARTGSNQANLLARSAVYLGVRLLQSAIEYSGAQVRIVPQVGCMLQVARNILARPEVALVHLLGIRPEN